jgi:hypothetical protein
VQFDIFMWSNARDGVTAPKSIATDFATAKEEETKVSITVQTVTTANSIAATCTAAAANATTTPCDA